MQGKLLSRPLNQDQLQDLLRGLWPFFAIYRWQLTLIALSLTVDMILNLLLRFYDPQHGSLVVDSHDLRRVTQKSWRSQIAVVFQDSFLFDTTMRENIRMGNPQAIDREVEDAARAAEIHDFIVSLPRGYDSRTGDRGSSLSGGQRQRLAIARAILRNPAILVLDEATSALDPSSESAINETLTRLARTRTVIAVTHRLRSVKRADQMFVLHGGRIVEREASGAARS